MLFCGETPKACLTNNQIQYETRMNTCRNAQFTQSKDPPLQARFPLPHVMIIQLSSVVTGTVPRDQVLSVSTDTLFPKSSAEPLNNNARKITQVSDKFRNYTVSVDTNLSLYTQRSHVEGGRGVEV